MKSKTKATRVITVLLTVQDKTPPEATYSDDDIVDCLRIRSAIPELKVLGATAQVNES